MSRTPKSGTVCNTLGLTSVIRKAPELAERLALRVMFSFNLFAVPVPEPQSCSPMRSLLLACLILSSPVSLPGQDMTTIKAINHTLDQLHDAASKADGKRYFSLFTDN